MPNQKLVNAFYLFQLLVLVLLDPSYVKILAGHFPRTDCGWMWSDERQEILHVKTAC